MLKQMIDELEFALANAIKVEDRMNQDGVTFEYLRKVIKFHDTEIELKFSRRPGSGLVADSKEDPKKGPKYTLTIFVPTSKKVLDTNTHLDLEPKLGTWRKNIFVDSPCPETEFLLALLQSADLGDHDAVIAQRKQEAEQHGAEAKKKAWAEKLSATGYAPEDHQVLIDYAATVLPVWKIARRGDIFIDLIVKYCVNIMAQDLEACGAVENSNPEFRPKYTLLDSMYNIIAQLLEKQVQNHYGDMVVPDYAINGRFMNMEAECNPRMPTYVRATRAFLRELYSQCMEKATTFTYVITGIAKYYERVTGESLDLRIARNNSRKKPTTGNIIPLTKAGQKVDKPKLVEIRPASPEKEETTNLGSLGDALTNAGL